MTKNQTKNTQKVQPNFSLSLWIFENVVLWQEQMINISAGAWLYKT